MKLQVYLKKMVTELASCFTGTEAGLEVSPCIAGNLHRGRRGNLNPILRMVSHYFVKIYDVAGGRL